MKRKLLVTFATFAGLNMVAGYARAQVAGYAASVFEPSERGSDWFSNESNDYRGKFRVAAGVLGDYGYRGVVGERNSDGSIRASVLRNQVFVHAGLSFVLAERLRLGVSVPFQVYADGHPATVDGIAYSPPVSAQSVGDLRTSLDLRLAGEYGDPATLAIGASLFIPVGQRDNFTGDDSTRFAPHLNIAGDIGEFAYALRGGFELRTFDDVYIDTELGDNITFGGAVGVRLANRHLLIGPELYGRSGLSDGPSAHDTPVEALIGAHVNVAQGFRINAGAGTFLEHDFGATSLRALFGIEFYPDPEKPDLDGDGIYDVDDACPRVSGIRTADSRTNGCPPPPPDRDGDGIVDSADACPDVAGVPTNDPKTNGCPPDRDADGILDTEDACPDVAGVRTNDPKTNGCPSDRDGDSILDAVDACPDLAGIATNDPKTNGCPDTDRDKDGVLNDVDACPDQAGPKSADLSTSGCPRVYINNKLIKILEQPKFDYNKAKIKPESDSLLTEVAQVMKDHPEIKVVRVEGHTDDKGSDAYNLKLSQQRADSVVQWLSSHGVDASRLSAKGMGEGTPLVANDSDANRALNRRVEFHIEDQEKTVKEMVKTPKGTVPAPTPASKPAAP